MKELSIEEKARRYDEAIERAREYVSKDDVEVTEYIFPELKESEDERIRKDMIETIKKEAKDFPSSVIAEKSNSWIAWLEKQGEHANFRNKIQIGDKVTRNEGGVLVNLSQLKRVAKPADKVEQKFKVGDFVKNVNHHKQPIYKVVDIDKECYICISDDVTLGDNTVVHFTFDNPYLRLVEQKSTWNEEDEKYTKDLVDYFIGGLSLKHTEEDIAKWLKSLKDRIQPQLKQEWSERDNLMLGKCIDAASGYYSPEDKQSMKDWLYFLKDRYTWKPSDEQIMALRWVLNHIPYDSHKEEISGLLEQLMKLREE